MHNCPFGPCRGVRVHPFKPAYIAVSSCFAHKIRLQPTSVQPSLVFLFLASVLLLLSAERLANRAIFYYISASALTLSANLLIAFALLYSQSQVFAVDYLLNHSDLTQFRLCTSLDRLCSGLLQRPALLTVYLTACALPGLAIVYCTAPYTRPFTVKLFQHFLRMIAAVLILYSVQIWEVGLSVLLGVLTMRVGVPRFRRRSGAEQRRPLTLQTVGRSAVLARSLTSQALEELRAYCQHAELTTPTLLSRLRRPQRMHAFLTTGVHLSDDEIRAFNRCYPSTV